MIKTGAATQVESHQSEERVHKQKNSDGWSTSISNEDTKTPPKDIRLYASTAAGKQGSPQATLNTPPTSDSSRYSLPYSLEYGPHLINTPLQLLYEVKIRVLQQQKKADISRATCNRENMVLLWLNLFFFFCQ